MVLDPLTTIGCASSVLQIVDFTSKLISKGRGYYKSADGTLAEHTENAQIASRLASLNKDLDKSLHSLSTSRRGLQSHELALCDVVQNCRMVAEEFNALVEGLRVSGSQNKAWKSFRQACKTVWSKDKIDYMLARLDRLRQEVVVHLLFADYNGQKRAITSMTDKLGKHENNIIQAILSSNAHLKQDVTRLCQQISAAKMAESQEIIVKWQCENEHKINAILQTLQNRQSKDQKVLFQRKILESLYFEKIEERRHHISDAHKETFEWVFDPPLEHPPWTDMRSWLQGHGPGMYWLAGKPGSGKSTLVKYLYDEKRTQGHLETWAAGKGLLLASCFFWNAGTNLQKSLAGMLRSLLYDLLKQVPAQIPSALPAEWFSFDLGLAHSPAWSNKNLCAALTSFIEENSTRMNVCFFVDGLDEFEGNEDERIEITELLRSLASYTNVRICVSSRPWLVFQDAFEHGPKLILQDLTKKCIESYVNNTLGSHQKYQALLRLGDQYRDLQLVSELVEKAQGVFLWVTLVVRSLLQGLRNDDTIRDLIRRLRKIPAELDAYFTQIMGKMDPTYYEQTAIMFQIALQTYDELTLMLISFIPDWLEDADFASKLPLAPVPEIEVRERLRVAERRLNASSLGLLEIYERQSEGLFAYQRVTFLHRTVTEFLKLPHTKALLNIYLTRPFDTNQYVFDTFIAQLKMLNRQDETSEDTDNFIYLLEYCLLYAQLIRNSNADAEVAILTKLNSVTSAVYRMHRHHRRQVGRGHEMRHWLDLDDGSLLSVCVCHRFNKYVISEINRCPELARMPRRPPLLDLALRERAMYSVIPVLDVSQLWRGGPSAELVKTLLQHGADPNEMRNDTNKDSTVWMLFIENISRLRTVEPDERAVLLQCTELLIKHGANAQIRKSPTHLGGDYLFQKATKDLDKVFSKDEVARLDRLL